MRRSIGLSLVVMVLFAMTASAGTEVRLTGKIIDAATKKPIPNATVLVTNAPGAGKTFKQEFKAKEDGTYAVFLLDGTIRYVFTFSAPGYAPFAEPMKLGIGSNTSKDIALAPPGAATGGNTAEAKPDPAAVAYNEGAALANEGKLPEAIAKMEEALSLKPDLTLAYGSLARLYFRQKEYDKAIDRANKVLAVDADDTDMNSILFEAYTAKGDSKKAAEYKSKVPANPAALFNDAARLINANNDAEAEKLLKQAIAADEKFAPAQYELGMIYVRAGKSGDAKTHLEKYLELEPNGKDAATAKEMLKYVK